jgi:hypothetical protein
MVRTMLLAARRVASNCIDRGPGCRGTLFADLVVPA